MKKLITLITCSLFFISCSNDDGIGNQGPQGPPGEDGEDGLIGTVFDIDGNFTAENDYSIFASYADFTEVEVFDTDVVLVYLRVGQDGEADGEPVYIWRQLPQTYYIEGGTVQYTFDYTFFDVNIFLDSNVELSSLEPAFTQDQFFRVAILPASFLKEASIDVSNYNAVKAALNLQDRKIPKKGI